MIVVGFKYPGFILYQVKLHLIESKIEQDFDTKTRAIVMAVAASPIFAIYLCSLSYLCPMLQNICLTAQTFRFYIFRR